MYPDYTFLIQLVLLAIERSLCAPIGMDLVHERKGCRVRACNTSSTHIGGHRATHVPGSARFPLSPRTPPIGGNPRFRTNPMGRGRAHEAPSDHSQRGSARTQGGDWWLLLGRTKHG